MSLSEETFSLQRTAHNLMYLDMDDSPAYSDDLSHRNDEVYRVTTTLYSSGFKGSTIEKQANVCLTLLMGYNASFIDRDEGQEHIREILNHCWDILEALPVSLLKLRLLTAYYGGVYDEPLVNEARKVIAGWASASLTSDHKETIEEFQNMVDNPYPWEYMDK